jgi:hypothetical protein
MLPTPKRYEDIQDFMITQHPTPRMRMLERKLEKAGAFAVRKKITDDIYEEYMKNCKIQSLPKTESTFDFLKNMILSAWTLRPSLTGLEEEMVAPFLPRGTKDEFLQETMKWLNIRLPYFHNLRRNMHIENQLLVGNVQAGKTVASIAFAMVKMMEGQPCVMVLLNSIGSTHQIEDKCRRFFKEHADHMNTIFSDFEQFGVTLAGNMSQTKIPRDESGTVVKHLVNCSEALEVLQGNANKIILVMNNGHQLQYMNQLAKCDILPFTMLCDEADAVAYGLIKEEDERSDINAAYEFSQLRESAAQTVEVSATVWDILVGNRDLRSSAITEITTTGPYKRMSDIITQTFPVDMPKKIVEVTDDLNLEGFYTELSKLKMYGVEYGRSTPHPIVVLHKTSTKQADHDAFIEYFHNHPVFKNKWCAIREDSRGILVASRQFAEEYKFSGMIIGSYVADENEDGLYMFPNKVDVQQVLYFLKEYKLITHYVIKSGGCCSRSKSYVSQDGDIHLTHEYYYPGASERGNVPSLIQGVRLHHNRPDAIPLTLTTTNQIAMDLRCGNLMQEEIIYRLMHRVDQCSTSVVVPVEKWNKKKVPKAKMTHSPLNKSFRAEKSPLDGGWDTSTYEDELCKIMKASFRISETEELDIRTSPIAQLDDREHTCVLLILEAITGAVETQIMEDMLVVITSMGLNVWHRRADIQSALAKEMPDKYGTYQLGQRFKATTKVWGQSEKKSSPSTDSTRGLVMKKCDGEWSMKLNRE